MVVVGGFGRVAGSVANFHQSEQTLDVPKHPCRHANSAVVRDVLN